MPAPPLRTARSAPTEYGFLTAISAQYSATLRTAIVIARYTAREGGASAARIGQCSGLMRWCACVEIVQCTCFSIVICIIVC